MILGVGIGDLPESFVMFGQPGDARTRAGQLAEALDVITRLWRGERVAHRGEPATLGGFTLAAVPMPPPRVPIWVAGDSRPAKRRTARWDGWIGPDNNPTEASAADLGQVREDLSVLGAGNRGDVVLAWAGAPDTGTADWPIRPVVGPVDACRAFIDAGPT